MHTKFLYNYLVFELSVFHLLQDYFQWENENDLFPKVHCWIIIIIIIICNWIYVV